MHVRLEVGKSVNVGFAIRILKWGLSNSWHVKPLVCWTLNGSLGGYCSYLLLLNLRARQFLCLYLISFYHNRKVALHQLRFRVCWVEKWLGRQQLRIKFLANFNNLFLVCFGFYVTHICQFWVAFAINHIREFIDLFIGDLKLTFYYSLLVWKRNVFFPMLVLGLIIEWRVSEGWVWSVPHLILIFRVKVGIDCLFSLSIWRDNIGAHHLHWFWFLHH